VTALRWRSVRFDMLQALTAVPGCASQWMRANTHQKIKVHTTEQHRLIFREMAHWSLIKHSWGHYLNCKGFRDKRVGCARLPLLFFGLPPRSAMDAEVVRKINLIEALEERHAGCHALPDDAAQQWSEAQIRQHFSGTVMGGTATWRCPAAGSC